MGVSHQAEGGIFIGRAHGKFIHIGLAYNQRPGGFEAGNDRGVIDRLIIGEQLGAAGGQGAFYLNVIFDGDGNPGQGKGWVIVFGLFLGQLRAQGQKGVQGRGRLLILLDGVINLSKNLLGFFTVFILSLKGL